jgi:hypothetical protein
MITVLSRSTDLALTVMRRGPCPLKTEDRYGGVYVFRYVRDTPNPGIKELAQAGGAMVSPLRDVSPGER